MVRDDSGCQHQNNSAGYEKLLKNIYYMITAKLTNTEGTASLVRRHNLLH
jgi:hypothetical protein